MSEVPIGPAPVPARRSCLGGFAKLLLGIGAFCFLWLMLMAGIGLAQLEIIFTLLLGWISFLGRTLPRITWNPDLIAMGVLCAAAVLFLSHRFLSWLTKSIAAARGASWQWPWRWTWCGLSALLVLFLVGMSIGGVTHQLGWIASSPETLFERKGFEFYQKGTGGMHNIEMGFRLASVDSSGSFVELCRKIRDQQYGIIPGSGSRSVSLQDFHVLLVIDGQDKVAGIIIFPRDPQLRAKVGGLHSTFDGQVSDNVQPEKLPDLIKLNQEHLRAF